jgi:hypothetical protein
VVGVLAVGLVLEGAAQRIPGVGRFVVPPAAGAPEQSSTLCTDAGANARYVKPSSSGTASGTSWTNALGSNWTPARGLTYCLADGSYGSKTLSTAASGTTTITIVKATTTDHGATANGGDDGWVSTLGDGQASWTSINVQTPYWIVNGATRTASNTWTAPTGYGFAARSIESVSDNFEDGSHSTFSYIDIGPAYDTTYSAGGTDSQPFNVQGQTDITLSRCALHNYIHTGVQGSGTNNLTIEYCHIGPGWGKEAIRGGNGSATDNWIIRYNRFWNASQTDPDDGTSGITAEIGIWDAGSGSFDGNAVYGNWFFNQFSGGRNAIIVIGGDGGGGWNGVTGSNNVVYNNTFAGIAEASVFADILLNGGTGNIARNNLFYSAASTVVSANTTSDNDVAGADPFVDYTNRDFRLSGATSPGFSLSSPYTSDPNSCTRGGDGTWDVGAFEYPSC